MFVYGGFGPAPNDRVRSYVVDGHRRRLAGRPRLQAITELINGSTATARTSGSTTSRSRARASGSTCPTRARCPRAKPSLFDAAEARGVLEARRRLPPRQPPSARAGDRARHAPAARPARDRDRRARATTRGPATPRAGSAAGDPSPPQLAPSRRAIPTLADAAPRARRRGHDVVQPHQAGARRLSPADRDPRRGRGAAAADPRRRGRRAPRRRAAPASSSTRCSRSCRSRRCARRPRSTRGRARADVRAVVEPLLRRHGRDPGELRAAALRLAHAALTAPLPVVGGALPGLPRAAQHGARDGVPVPVPGRGGRRRRAATSKGSSTSSSSTRGARTSATGRPTGCPPGTPRTVAAHVDANYALQERLYALALVRMLGIADAAAYEARFGGTLYVFVRGLGRSADAVRSRRPTLRRAHALAARAGRHARRGGRARDRAATRTRWPPAWARDLVPAERGRRRGRALPRHRGGGWPVAADDAERRAFALVVLASLDSRGRRRDPARSGDGRRRGSPASASPKTIARPRVAARRRRAWRCRGARAVRRRARATTARSSSTAASSITSATCASSSGSPCALGARASIAPSRTPDRRRRGGRAAPAGTLDRAEQAAAIDAARRRPFDRHPGGPARARPRSSTASSAPGSPTGFAADRIAIAAPTGKAANRIAELLRTAGARRPVPARCTGCSASPAAARLRGGEFRHHENHPLPHAAVIVDEASMVGLALMEQLSRALAPDARLVLIGDGDQLPAVDVGSVFRDLVAARRAVRLTGSHRMDPADPAGAAVLDAAQRDRARRSRRPRRARRAHAGRARRSPASPASSPTATTPQRASARAGRRSSITGTRPGSGPAPRPPRAELSRCAPGGDDELEPDAAPAVIAALAHQQRSPLADRHPRRLRRRRSDQRRPRPAGRDRRRPRRAPRPVTSSPGTPVMITRNDYDRGLYNGDQGIVLSVVTREGGAPTLAAVFARGGAPGTVSARRPRTARWPSRTRRPCTRPRAASWIMRR